MVGNFEEGDRRGDRMPSASAIRNDGIVLAATAGAINVRLGGQILTAAQAQPGGSGWPEGREPQLAPPASLVGLVWRSVVLWLLLLALTTMAHSVG